MERSFSTLAALVGDGPCEDPRTLAAVQAIIERIRRVARVSEDNFAEEDFAAISGQLDAWFGAHIWDMREVDIASAKADLLGHLMALCALICWDRDHSPQ